MATTTTNFGWDIPQSTDLVKDGATAIAALGQDIDTALIDLKGGTTGQVLAKASGTDLDFSWVAQDDSNAIQNAIVDAKGDLISATAADTPARLAVGANGTILTADSTTATGLAWAAPAAGGGGLTLITRSSFTSTATVNIDSVFSSTYRDYRVIVDLTSSINEGIRLRYRAGGTAYTGSTYQNRGINIAANSHYSQNTDFILLGEGGTSRFGASIDFYAPNITGFTNYTLLSAALSTGAFASAYVIGGWNDISRSEDGIQIYGSSGGNLTGHVLVYGYKES